ncbi:hypothetical protein BDU57DRAFT_535431 [Ampelomyces quisqualis]|uniref:DUF7918 domain-containing protein n=1 Tax=Ampelomyces quisqualis TaxID=50730 RepID=A0A6A5R3S7_AMPQU|nr:hypothetical protein BDU57DRAFT_535431 [Ampelomyces quisqualis]
MAVHPEHPGLSAELVVNGEALREYNDDEHTSKNDVIAIAKYVEVNEDAHFGIRYTIPQGFSNELGVHVNLKIDGNSVRKHTHNKHQLRHAKRDIVNCLDACNSTIDGVRYSQRFRFSRLQIGEEDVDADETTSEQLKDVGIITLKLAFINDIGKRPVSRGSCHYARSARQERLPMIGKVAEKNLKGDARSHQASLDAPVAVAYGSQKPTALKSLHMMPRTPSPSPGPPTKGVMNEVERDDAEAFTPTNQQSNQMKTEVIKEETAAGIKREANAGREQDEVLFVGSKRLRRLTTQRNEVIVLD